MLNILLIFLALAGIIDSAVLHRLDAAGTVGKICEATGFGECEAVLTSSYSKMLGLPLTVWGLVYYSTIFWLALGSRISREARSTLAALTGLGVVCSLWFTYLQAFVIRAWCPFCLVSALITLLAFVIALVEWRRPLSAAATESTSKEPVTAGGSPSAPVVPVIWLIVGAACGLGLSALVPAPEPVVEASILERVMTTVPRRRSGPGGLREGYDTATITVQTFLDFTCPYCAKFEREVYPVMKRKYVESGRVLWISKVFPHSRGGPAFTFAQVAVCARGETEAWDVQDMMFEYPRGGVLTGPPLIEDLLRDHPALKARVLDCLAARAGQIEAKIVEEVHEAAVQGLQGPPALIIDGIPFQGFMTADVMGRTIDAFLRMRAIAAGGAPEPPPNP